MAGREVAKEIDNPQRRTGVESSSPENNKNVNVFTRQQAVGREGSVRKRSKEVKV